MTPSQEKLVRHLQKLNGGKYPLKKWSLSDVFEELRSNIKVENKTFHIFEGEFESRLVGDSLIQAGFNITIDPNKQTFTVVW